MKLTVCFILVYVTGSFAYPVSQPAYQDTPYISAQSPVQYRQPQTYLTPQYVTAPVPAQQQPAKPVYEGLQKFSTQIRQPIQQVLLATNVDRQIQRVAQAGGQLFLQHIQAAQQQGQAQQALDAAQRKATSQTLSRQIQPLPLPIPQQQPQPQPHYLRVVPQPAPIKYQPAPVKYAAPAAPGYRPYVQPQQQHQQQQQQHQGGEQQNPEEYDPNPSYQFGFDVNDDLYTNYQNRKEQREGGKITGSYSVVDPDGFVRTVTYHTDPKEGFKAEVTRQPTNIVVKIPKPDPQFQRPAQHYIQQAAPVQQKAEAQAQQPNLIQYQYQ
ncbi:hypothetical protein TcasGA2_TC002908 [Tribolium castaneum]|uniref:Pupal cuticle protein Edg-84A-like Protein n=1 Tax=Tribolium castaneum TaxID=7070 RepID=D6WHG5_TRICA|nr:PREDICTED: transcription factor SPT20 homolog [Tribolium castaneum]EFA00093.1 hypothetical protein TcasGA2_TC002908 [Tribolium castaneum]|eukprot:XP_015833594.1 PREDICTED: transcription factor SPT20 homolog [Tribolium castaneum]